MHRTFHAATLSLRFFFFSFPPKRIRPLRCAIDTSRAISPNHRRRIRTPREFSRNRKHLTKTHARERAQCVIAPMSQVQPANKRLPLGDVPPQPVLPPGKRGRRSEVSEAVQPEINEHRKIRTGGGEAYLVFFPLPLSPQPEATRSPLLRWTVMGTKFERRLALFVASRRAARP